MYACSPYTKPCSPFQVYGHGFLTKNGMKMGKSLGNTLDPKVRGVCLCSHCVELYQIIILSLVFSA